MKKSLKINEDWERESLKDLVYLYEEQLQLENRINNIMRKPAEIIIVDEDKILEKNNEYQHNPLPF